MVKRFAIYQGQNDPEDVRVLSYSMSDEELPAIIEMSDGSERWVNVQCDIAEEVDALTIANFLFGTVFVTEYGETVIGAAEDGIDPEDGLPFVRGFLLNVN